MITQCTSCNRRFRIYARQLSAASGLVQCGFCGTRFNALEQLSDEPLPPVEEIQISESIVKREDPVMDIVIGPANVEMAEEIAEEPVVQTLTPADELTEELWLPPPEPRRSWFSTVLWSVGVLVLLLVLLVQAAWFNRDPLLVSYPQYIPLVKQFCEQNERIGCDWVRERDLASIVLVNRDVRDHPRYNDMLLVNLTIENRAARPQPWPGIQLTLIDNAGAVTGYRRLPPAEYLEPGANIDAGMRSNQPLHLVLEVAETSRKPVGFEFDFF